MGIMGYYCNECEADISQEEFEFSTERYHRVLCRSCQSENRRSKPVSTRKKKSSRERIGAEPQTSEERALLQALRKRGLRVESQKWDGYKHIDLTIPDARVNIEVNGLQHGFNPKQALADLKRTYYSWKKGWLTLRVPNVLVKNHLEETADYVVEFIKESMEELEDDDDLWG